MPENTAVFDQWADNYDESISPDEKGYPFEGYYDVLGRFRRRRGFWISGLELGYSPMHYTDKGAGFGEWIFRKRC